MTTALNIPSDPAMAGFDAGLLTLAQWMSPAYPLGSFAYSHGLESAIRAGWIATAADLRGWLEDLLQDGSGRADASFLWAAWRAETEAALLALDAEARAFSPAAERQREGARQGAAFARSTAAVWGIALPELLLPLAIGRAARLMGLDPQAACALYLQSFTSNLVSAAVRLIPLGQTEGQQVLAALSPLCPRIAAETSAGDPAAVYSNAFLSDIAAMTHETLEPRLFQS
ncbi:urease accessory protein UreF [Pseudodonghicola flavimaris]|uniref:Urease accessory protein UreF n=1 Tax=Pseudodonghicola flavimaris TaxID=3050036 RepID=A0ABT7F5F0_9RHOB|nr:urease accessory UreF family protein [Pseudodonghicola flavimaris]MDK3019848.1 urease accessory UreF family protein [Pseudodonghicola flavimaris]